MSERAREWRFYVDDMIAFGEKVLAYTAGLDQSTFVANGLVYDATLRNLELIGEAAAFDLSLAPDRANCRAASALTSCRRRG